MYKKEEIYCTDNERQNEMDNNSAFAEFEMENREEFSDYSDYGELQYNLNFLSDGCSSFN